MPAPFTSSERSPLLTAVEAAAFLRRSPYTLADWRSAGTGPAAIKIKGRWHYERATLEAWVRDQQAA